MSSLVHVPLSRPSAVLNGDRLAELHARRALRVLNPDLVIARARRMAKRSLPRFASLSCGCHEDALCRAAALLFLGAADANTREAKLYEVELVQHRRALHAPGVRIYFRFSDPYARAAALRDYHRGGA